MDTLLSYIKNIGFFLILVSVVCNALPENSYKKYCKLFCGLVLVVLVLNPFNELLNYEGDIGDIFVSESYQAELLQLEANLKLQESEQMEQALSNYEEELKKILQNTADEEGLKIVDVDVRYTEEGEELLLQGVHIYATDKNIFDNKDGEYDKNSSERVDINLDEVHIDDIEISLDDNEGGDNENSIDKLSPGDRPKAIKLIERVAELLSIETYMISITIE